MPVIRILSDRVANQIAAGEVIERPAAVVKELVENSLDAGATRIEVEFRHGGRSYLRVEDNGSGMSRDDALLSLERHATSKIAETADLDRLGTFGFRGEALPSIASVSRFELQTRAAGAAAGTEILVNGGKFVHVRDCGVPGGTRIVVTHLFNSVPARRKFLKSDQTESAHLIQTTRLYALACPQTAFTLIEDGRVIFRSPVCPTLAERVAEIFGRQLAEGLLPVGADGAGLRLSGLIGRPGTGRATRHEMIVFVNRRPVDSRTLHYALIESYHTLLPKGRYPVAVLFLELDPASVDVNVHPAKREVRFRDESAVRAFVMRAVMERLREGSGEGEARGMRAAFLPSSHPASAPPPTVPQEGRLATPFPVFRPFVAPPSASPPPGSPPPASAPPALAARPSASLWRFLGLTHRDYALFETADGLMFLDRRAAHERVWFERLEDQFRLGAVAAQRLLLPIPVELDPIASALLLDRLAFLHRHGFEIVEFGRNFFRIEGLPVWLDPADAEPFLRDLLGAFRDGRLDGRNPALAREELARIAASKAVRLPESANETEAHALVAQLFACRQPLTSPAGRPTHLEISQAELARRFQK